MLLDAQNLFTDNSSTYDGTQTVTGATTVASYNAIDMGVGTAATTPTRNPGAGQPLFLVTQIVTKDTGHTSPTLNIKLVGDTTSAFSNSYIIVQTGIMANATLTDSMIISLPIPPLTAYRYFRVEFGLNHADNSFVIKSFLSAIAPSPYGLGFPAKLS